MAASPVAQTYASPINRESAFEMLKAKAEQAAAAQQQAQPAQPAAKAAPAPRVSTRMTPTEAMFNSAMRSVGTQLGRALIRGVLGSLTRR